MLKYDYHDCNYVLSERTTLINMCSWPVLADHWLLLYWIKHIII